MDETVAERLSVGYSHTPILEIVLHLKLAGSIKFHEFLLFTVIICDL